MSFTPGSSRSNRLNSGQGGPVFSGLDGNEMWCLDKIGFAPGDLVIGNSVYSVGLLGGLRSVGRSALGGEMKQYTEIISEGRRLALQRMEGELGQVGATGATGVTTEIIEHAGNIEFLSVGSGVHSNAPDRRPFTSAADGQSLYCQIDAHYYPMRFVFGNVVYSVGIAGGIMGSLRSLGRGEIKEFSQIFNTTRHLALTRIEADARQAGANSIVGIETTILPFAGAHEMMVVGTASNHPDAPNNGEIITSALSAEEHWTLSSMGYMPLKYLMGTSVYSLGVVGSVTSFFKNFVKGEITELTSLIYDARENALHQLQQQAAAAGADDVMGVRTHVYHLGNGIVEFLARGTAIKKVDKGAGVRSENLPPQAFIRSRDTFVDTTGLGFLLSQGE